MNPEMTDLIFRTTNIPTEELLVKKWIRLPTKPKAHASKVKTLVSVCSLMSALLTRLRSEAANRSTSPLGGMFLKLGNLFETWPS